ncbi:class I SAM-dependent methyltransferase [Archaeoglobus neptunius]|uniref:class I SAM-dependent methyltransferase n=1 Tax=Archaeoglobus neptunius TaxID=2798580 RepID=UPI001E57902C|nr:class I SAM-dependent methyltransferase [Archaeoglobus neptunius]
MMKSDVKRYNRIAPLYDLMESPMELINFKRWRKLLFDEMKADENSLILEIGVGTGKNIPFYRNNHFVAIDISEKMIARAKKKSGSKIVDLVIADAERMPFKDESFDIVYSTFVFCSVDDPVRGLKEAYRVLKKGGKAYFLEHMLPENRILAAIFNILNPLFRFFGPEINRRTDKNIRKAGFRIEKQIFLLGSVFRLITAVKDANTDNETSQTRLKRSEMKGSLSNRRFN